MCTTKIDGWRWKNVMRKTFWSPLVVIILKLFFQENNIFDKTLSLPTRERLLHKQKKKASVILCLNFCRQSRFTVFLQPCPPPPNHLLLGLYLLNKPFCISQLSSYLQNFSIPINRDICNISDIGRHQHSLSCSNFRDIT